MSKRNVKPEGLDVPNRTVEKIIKIEQEDELTINQIKIFAIDEEALKAYINDNKDPFTNIILFLIHKQYKEKDAKALWNKLLIHMQHLEQKLGRAVGINVSAMDYLENISTSAYTMTTIGEEEMEDLASMTTKDELTGLYVRGIYETFMEKHFAESRRNGTNLAYAMFDIDNFKKVNDTYGHQKGDDVLKKIGTIILENIRIMDMGVRYGGEELGVIFPNADVTIAKNISERIRREIEAYFKENMQITVSCGVSDIQGKETFKALAKAADTALYDAKQHGKNRTCVS